MGMVTGVFKSYGAALEAVRQLQELGIPNKRIGILTPGKRQELETIVPTVDTEEPGMGTAMGAAVGGAMGAAGGATLGLAVASLAVPGVGPVLALGLLGAAVLGAGGAAIGGLVGDSLEEELGEGLPHEDVYLYEDALRHGHSVVIAYSESAEQDENSREVLTDAGAEDLGELRENWWREVRDQESLHYDGGSKDFERDESSFRRGFQAAQHPEHRGRPLAEVDEELRVCYPPNELDSAFRHGYERGLSYQRRSGEIHEG